MQMTVTLPEELGRKARELAEAEHRTLNDLIVNAVDEYVQRHGIDQIVAAAAAEGARRYAKALDKLDQGVPAVVDEIMSQDTELLRRLAQCSTATD